MLEVKLYKKLNHFPLEVQFSAGAEIIVLFGPSGSGKTTILDCIAGLSHPDKGNIRLNQRTLFGKQTNPVSVQKRNIGYLFQDYALFPHMTVRKNIEYGMKNEALVQQLIHVIGIRHLLSRYPRQISGGEKQRVALIRALATKPEALLLDEPFSALDETTREACQNELLRLHTTWNIPIIMVTHNRQEAEKLGDRIIQIKQGKLEQTT